MAKHHGLETDFLTAYKEVDGDLKALRIKKVPEKDITWDVERNRRLKVCKTMQFTYYFNAKNNIV